MVQVSSDRFVKCFTRTSPWNWSTKIVDLAGRFIVVHSDPMFLSDRSWLSLLTSWFIEYFWRRWKTFDMSDSVGEDLTFTGPSYDILTRVWGETTQLFWRRFWRSVALFGAQAERIINMAFRTQFSWLRSLVLFSCLAVPANAFYSRLSSISLCWGCRRLDDRYSCQVKVWGLLVLESWAWDWQTSLQVWHIWTHVVIVPVC